MTAVLYALPASHPCAVVERAMQLKRIPYRRVELIPVAHKLPQRARFGAGTVPGVAFEDGARAIGSRPILRALEQRVAEPALLPAGDDLGARVARAEEWGDQVLQALVRRVVWAALRRAPGAIDGYAEGAKLPVPRAVARLSAPLVARMAARANGAGDPPVRADLIALPGPPRPRRPLDRRRHAGRRGRERRGPPDRREPAAAADGGGPPRAARRPGGGGAGAAVVPGVPPRGAGGDSAGRVGSGVSQLRH
jgi:glutathione S-transferase